MNSFPSRRDIVPQVVARIYTVEKGSILIDLTKYLMLKELTLHQRERRKQKEQFSFYNHFKGHQKNILNEPTTPQAINILINKQINRLDDDTNQSIWKIINKIKQGQELNKR